VTSRCLVVHPGALGDVLLAGPALGHLRALGFRTTLAVTSRLVALFARSGLVDDARDLESLSLHRLFAESPGPGALDAVSSFDAFVCWLGAGEPAFRANLAQLGRPAVVARTTPPPGSGRHVSRHLVETLAPLGPVPGGLPTVHLGVAEVGRVMARTWLAGRGIGPGEAVVIQPGAGSTAKVWPGFAALTRRLRAADLPLVALAGPADGSVVEALLTTGALGAEELARGWPLPDVAALFSLARGAVGNDSGPTHLAAAVGCPTVAIFGPTDPLVWAPVGSRVRVVAGRPGSPPWADVDRVEAELRALLAGTGPESAGEPRCATVGPAWR
jgi:glycosyl transferase family 9 (putative heptosyltransferase)